MNACSKKCDNFFGQPRLCSSQLISPFFISCNGFRPTDFFRAIRPTFGRAFAYAQKQITDKPTEISNDSHYRSQNTIVGFPLRESLEVDRQQTVNDLCPDLYQSKISIPAPCPDFSSISPPSSLCRISFDYHARGLLDARKCPAQGQARLCNVGHRALSRTAVSRAMQAESEGS